MCPLQTSSGLADLRVFDRSDCVCTGNQIIQYVAIDIAKDYSYDNSQDRFEKKIMAVQV